MNIVRDIMPLTQFKRDTARVIAQIKETGSPAVLTVNGRPSVVVVDAAVWARMVDMYEQPDLEDALAEGLADLTAGRVHTLEEVFAGIPD